MSSGPSTCRGESHAPLAGTRRADEASRTAVRPGTVGLALAGAAALYGASVLLGRFIRLWPWTVDDAFITFRYARHLAEGRGLQWNPGDTPAEGFTSLLWVLVSVIPHRFHIDVPAFAKVVSLVALGCSAALAALVAWHLLRDAGRDLRLVVGGATALVVAAHPMTAVHASSGMETALFTCLATALAYSAVSYRAFPSRRGAWSLALLSLLLGLARPEGNLLAGTVLVGLTIAQAGRGNGIGLVRPVLLAYVIPGSIYFVARWAFYGLLLPLPFYIKSSAGWEGVDQVIGFYRHAVGWICLPALLGFLSFWRRTWPLALATLLHSIFYLKPAHMMGFSWRYLYPCFPILVLAAGLAIARVLRSRPWLAVAATCLGAVVTVYAHGRGADATIEDHVAYARGLARAHVRLGRELAALSERFPGASPRLVVADAGAIPYYSDWWVLDSFGLNDREIARTGVRDLSYIYGASPDAVVILSRSAQTIDLRLGWEGPIAAEAQRLGYKVGGIYEFGAPHARPFGGYYLWLLMRPDLMELLDPSGAP